MKGKQKLMDKRTPPKDPSEAMNYVRSLRDSVKRRFANEYLLWVRGGKVGTMPSRGQLSLTLSKTIVLNLEALA